MADAIPRPEAGSPQRDMNADNKSSQSTWPSMAQKYRDRIRANPRDLEARVTLGMAYRLCQDYPAALAVWHSILEVDPRHEVAKRLIHTVEAEFMRE